MPAQRFEVERRTFDINSDGHVDNTVILGYWNEARMLVFAQVQDLRAPQWQTAIVRHEIEYRHEIFWSLRPVTVDIWAEVIGNTSFTMAGRIVDEHGTECAVARTVTVCIDPKTRTKMAVPQSLRTALEAMMGEQSW